MTEDPWVRAIPGKYITGQIIKGTITKLTNFGAFVELEPDLEGLLHVSELTDHKIESPQDIVKRGDEVEVKILKVDTETRKIGLSLRRAQWAAEEQAAEAGQPQTPSASQTVVSDSDVDEVEKPQQEPGEPKQADEANAEPTKPDEQAGQRVGPQAIDVEQTKGTGEPEQASDSQQTQERTEDESSREPQTGPDINNK